jgi:hypothetical protein
VADGRTPEIVGSGADTSQLLIELPEKREYTPEGYLIAPCRIMRTGILLYYGYELKKNNPELDLEDLRVYRVFNSPDVLFSDETVESFENKPFIGFHVPKVDSENWREFSDGFLRDIHRDEDDFLAGTLVITDKASIDQVDNGKRELSAGYDFVMIARSDMPSVCDIPEDVDFVRTRIIGNHVASVDEGRAGHECKISDEKEKDMEELKAMLQKLLDLEEAEAKNMGDCAAKDKQIEGLQSAHDGLKTAHDALKSEHEDLKTKHADLQKSHDALKAKMEKSASESDTEKAAEDRKTVCDEAVRLVSALDCKGKTRRQIMVEALKAKNQDCADLIKENLAGADMAQDSADVTVIRKAFDAVCVASKDNGFGAAGVQAPGADALREAEDYGKKLAKAHNLNEKK